MKYTKLIEKYLSTLKTNCFLFRCQFLPIEFAAKTANIFPIRSAGGERKSLAQISPAAGQMLQKG
jgi:hypothetical protein